MTSNRHKNYFITINKNAPCFDNLDAILKQETNCSYAYIIHDKDFNINDDGTHSPKNLHKHVVILFENARTFASMQKKYDGAHIEPVEYVNSTMQYLIHQNNPEKAQYTILDITSNIADIATYFTTSKEPFDADKILDYYIQGTKTFIMFYQRFGAQINKYQGLINTLIRDMKYEENYYKSYLGNDNE